MAVLERILDFENIGNLSFEGRVARIVESEYGNGVTRFDVRARNSNMQTRGLVLLGYSGLDFQLKGLEGKQVRMNSVVKRDGSIDIWQHLHHEDNDGILDIRQHIGYNLDSTYKVSGWLRRTSKDVTFENNYSFSFKEETQ